MSDQPMRGSDKDYCDVWPTEGHNMAWTVTGGKGYGVGQCQSCRWTDTSEIDEALAALRSEVERLTRERDEARFERNQERHARNLNELGLLAKLNESIDERDSLSSQLAEARAVENAARVLIAQSLHAEVGGLEFAAAFSALARAVEARKAWAEPNEVSR